MSKKIDKINECYSILKNYNGDNNYIKWLSKTYEKKPLTDFQIDYVLLNKDFKKEEINKLIKLSSWYAETKVEEWGIKAEKVKVISILGETEKFFHLFIKYRQSIAPSSVFIPKKAILGDIRATDYNLLDVDFTKYDNFFKKYNRKVLDHQKIAVKFLLTRKKCILADDMGLAKTASAIMASMEGNFNKILIITTASAKSTWERELKTFISEKDISTIDSNNWNDNKYTIINYDIVDRFYKFPTEINKAGKEVKSRKKEVKLQALADSLLYTANFDLVIIDEVHYLSDNKSIRYKIIEDFLTNNKNKYTFLLTGTPMTNYPVNFYHVLKLINHPVTDNYPYYVKTYCDGKNITVKKTGKKIWLTNGASNLEELTEKVKDVYLRREKEEIPGMVTKEIFLKYYDLTENEIEEYNKVWDEYVEAENKKTEANKDLIEGILLRQFIADKMIPYTIKSTDEFINKGEKVFIACNFNSEIAKLKEYYGNKAVVYKGGLTRKQKDAAEKSFMEDENVKVFIGNIKAAGVALTLISSHIVIFNSYDWVPGNNKQVMDRVHRLGQLFEVEVYFQLFRNTISEDMWETIVKKGLNIDKVIKAENKK